MITEGMVMELYEPIIRKYTDPIRTAALYGEFDTAARLIGVLEEELAAWEKRNGVALPIPVQRRLYGLYRFVELRERGE